MTGYLCHKICRYIHVTERVEYEPASRQTQSTSQHLYNFGPASKTLGRRRTHAIPMPCACRDWPKVERLSLYNKIQITVSHQTRDIEPMPVNVGPPSATPDQHQSGTGPNVWRLLRRDRSASPITMLKRCRHVVFDVGPASSQQWLNVWHLLGVDVVQHRPIMVGHYHAGTLDRHLTSAVKYISSVHHSSKRRRRTSVLSMPGQRLRR